MNWTLEYIERGQRYSAEAGETQSEALAYGEHLMFEQGAILMSLINPYGSTVLEGAELEDAALGIEGGA
jgi:hypothetical protein